VKYQVIFLMLFAVSSSLAQDGVGVNTETIDASAIFQIESTDKGLLIPRMSFAQRTGISSPAEGLLVYQNSGTTGFYYYNGSSWEFVGDDQDWTETPSYLYTDEGLNVGIGTTTPDTDLHIYNTANVGVKLQRSSASGTANIEFYRGTGTGTLDASIGMNANEELVIQNHESNKDMKFLINDGGTTKQIMYFDASNNKIGVNLSSVPQDLIHADGAIRANSGFKANDGSGSAPGFRFYNDNNTGLSLLGVDNLGFITGGTAALQIDASGNTLPGADNTFSLGSSSFRFTDVYAVNGTIQTSDSTMKTNIVPLKAGLNEVLLLKPVNYEWKTDPTTPKIGFIAQEVEAVVPEVIQKSEDGIYGMNYPELIPVLVNAIQELEARVRALEDENLSFKKTAQR
jgi:hypothetical protein